MIKNLTYANDVEVTSLYGAVTIGAAGAITSQTSLGFTVAYDGSAGKYTATLDRPFPELLFASAVPSLATATECVLQLGAIDMANSARTVKFINTTSGVAAELASGTILYLMLVLKDSTCTP